MCPVGEGCEGLQPPQDVTKGAARLVASCSASSKGTEQGEAQQRKETSQLQTALTSARCSP